MSKKEMQILNRANSDNRAPFNYEQSQSKNVRLLNFSEDEFDRLAEQNTSLSQLSTASLAQKPSFNSRFSGACALLTTLGLASCFLQRLSTTVTSFGGLLMLFLFVVFMREWYRVYGNWLSRKKRANLSYISILKNNSNFIPCYDLQWLFGEKYAGYAYGCCLGDEITEEQPDNHSPPHSPTEK